MNLSCFVFCVCVFYSGFTEFAIATEDRLAATEENESVYERYMDVDRQLKAFVDQGIKFALPFIMQATEHINISSSCMKNVFSTMMAIKKLKLWALSILDANGKPVEGFITMNTHMLGDFDQCLNITVLKRDGQVDFTGQHCLVYYSFLTPKRKGPVSMMQNYEDLINATRNASELIRFVTSNVHFAEMMPSKFGLCVPSGCSKEDVEQLVKYVTTQFSINASVPYCQVEGSLPVITTRSIAILCAFSFLLLLGFIGTIAEYFFKGTDSSKSIFAKVLICFSIKTNFPKVMDTSTSDKTLTCLHGIRALTLFYVLMVHAAYALVIAGTAKHMGRVPTVVTRFSTQILVNAFTAVDVFFFMGGLLHSYLRKQNELKPDSEKKNIGSFSIIILRLWRIYPPYIFAILLSFLLMPRGPLAPIFQEIQHDVCEKYWWRNLLFINNLFKIRSMCCIHTWFLGAEMQIFLLSLFPVHLLLKNPKKGIILIVALMMFGIIATIILTYIGEVPISVPLTNFNSEEVERIGKLYFYPFLHMAPYFSGVLMGYLLTVKKDIQIPKVYQVIGWLISIVVFICLMFVSKKWYTGYGYTILESAFHWAFSKYMCSLAVGWMMFCCITGHGGIINYILSLKVWVPISRISYIAYLTSLTLQVFYATNQRASNESHEMIYIWQHFGDIVVIGLLSLALAVLLESPSIALQKLFVEIVFPKAPGNAVDGVVNTAFKENEETRASKGSSEPKGEIPQNSDITFELEMNHKNMITSF